MREFANRLMLHSQETNSTVPTAIFGTAGSLGQAIYINQPNTRIGLWPIQSQETPDIAMGLFAILGYLLDQYTDTHIYRLVARLDTDESEPERYEWNISKSQFDADDWQLEHLDDNVGIWGTLTQTEQTLTLTVEIENDLQEDDEVHTLRFSADSLSEVIWKLQALAADIAAYLELKPRLLTALYTQDRWAKEPLQQTLKNIFRWELNLYLHLWGITWQDSQMRSDIEQLQVSTQSLGNLGTWLVANAIIRLMTFVDVDLEGWLLPIIHDITAQSGFDHIATTLLGNALFNAQKAQDAYHLLETAIEGDNRHELSFLTLAELYQRSGRIDEAIDTFQSAIEGDYVSARLYRRYAEILIAMDYNNLDLDHVILADPDSSGDNITLREAVEAYQAALEIDPNQTEVLANLLLQLVDLDPDDERLWPSFRQLVQSEDTEDMVRTVVDALYTLDNLEPAADILMQAAQQAPTRSDLYIDLAIVDTFEGDDDHALAMLQKAGEVATGDQDSITADIEYLTLTIEDPEFEVHLGEITQIIDAGNILGAEDVEFLESILEKAPRIAEAYILLAKAYTGWDEHASALETLLDGHQHLPEDPDILELLCESLWKSGEEELALNYLSKGLADNPNHVPLLARAGLYLFEDGQEEAARTYLAKAEMINPRNPVLAQVRIQISRIIGQ